VIARHEPDDWGEPVASHEPLELPVLADFRLADLR